MIERDDLRGLHGTDERARDDLKRLLVELEQELGDAAHALPRPDAVSARSLSIPLSAWSSAGPWRITVELQGAPILPSTWTRFARFRQRPQTARAQALSSRVWDWPRALERLLVRGGVSARRPVRWGTADARRA